MSHSSFSNSQLIFPGIFFLQCYCFVQQLHLRLAAGAIGDVPQQGLLRSVKLQQRFSTVNLGANTAGKKFMLFFCFNLICLKSKPEEFFDSDLK